MAFQKAIFISFGLGTALALTACGPKDTTSSSGTGGMGGVVGTGGTAGMGAAGLPAGGGMGTAGAGTAGGAATGACNAVNFAAYASMPPVSFVNDLLPIFGQGCTASDCHNVHDKKAGLNLGYKCNYDPMATWKCTFPAMSADPTDVTMPAPDDPATQAAMLASLLGPSSTVNGGAMMRVKPGDPANSFIVLKLSDQQNSKGLACTNQDPTRDMTPCGGFMPLTGTAFCEGTSRPRFDAIVAWIAQGAKMN